MFDFLLPLITVVFDVNYVTHLLLVSIFFKSFLHVFLFFFKINRKNFQFDPFRFESGNGVSFKTSKSRSLQTILEMRKTCEVFITKFIYMMK